MFVDLHKEAEARQPLKEANKSTNQQPELILTEDASLSESKKNFLQTSRQWILYKKAISILYFGIDLYRFCQFE